MSNDVVKSISKLLYDNDLVIIPGFGGFEANYESARIDGVHGHLHPPRKAIFFNENIKTDDGLLLDTLVQKSGRTLAECKMTVETFVAECKEILNKKEIIALPEIGKIFKDIEQNVQFIPEDKNYLLDSYGLESIQYYPILRTEEALAQSQTIQPQITSNEDSRSRYDGWLKYAGAAAAMLLFVLIYLGWMNDSTEQTIADNDPLQELNINVKPKAEGTSLKTDDADAPLITMEDDISRQLQSDEETIDDAPMFAPDEVEKETSFENTGIENETVKDEIYEEKTCIIAIGAFRKEKGVRATLKKIEKAGFLPYIERMPNGLAKVGIQFDANKANASDMLRQVQKKIEPTARILRYE